jgi:soluble lytic murein transglycosylase-like protein
LRSISIIFFCLGTAAGIANAGSVESHEASRIRARSVVRADARSGRLVRTVVVQRPAAKAAPPAVRADVSKIIEATARKYEVDPLLVHSVISVESSYDPYAVSPKGAQGLMQLMPATARRFGVSNVFDAEDNIEGGVRYLKYLQTLFPNDTKLALAAYNAGEGAVWKYNNSVPPYRETEEYVLKVAKTYGDAKRAAEKRPDNEPAAVAPAQTELTQTAYAPIEAFMDAEGRLHMRTVATAVTP